MLVGTNAKKWLTSGAQLILQNYLDEVLERWGMTNSMIITWPTLVDEQTKPCLKFNGRIREMCPCTNAEEDENGEAKFKHTHYRKWRWNWKVTFSLFKKTLKKNGIWLKKFSTASWRVSVFLPLLTKKKQGKSKGLPPVCMSRLV